MKIGMQVMCSSCGNVVLAFVVNKWFDYAIFDWDAETYCEKCMGKYKYNAKPKDSNSTNSSMNVSNTDKNNEKK
jgi:hypothetical protein